MDIDLERGTSRLISAWLLLSIISLIFAGIFALLIALARTPVIKDYLPGRDYFYIALVTHVDLAFVIWFLTFMGVLWVLSSTTLLHTDTHSKGLGWFGFITSAIGTAFLILPALSGKGTPVLSNYVPVIRHPIFYTGLILFASGILITLINTVLTIMDAIKTRSSPRPFPLITFGMLLSGITVLVAFLCFGLAYILLQGSPLTNPIAGSFFERLFWGGGHILQFSNTIGMITVWIFIVYMVLKIQLPLSDRLAKVFLGIFMLFILPAPIIFFTNSITSQGYKHGFTVLMQMGIGPSTGLYMMAIALSIWTAGSGKGSAFRLRALPWGEPGFSSLIFSLLLFSLGSILALRIQGSNVKIPSHYHGVIGGVTIAFMGITYYILPVLKKHIYSIKAARLQPYLYGIGQMMFVVGMFWAGTHGVPRKTFGSAEVLRSYPEYAGMAIMGIGGLIAIAGGAVYVVNIIVSFLMPEET